MTVPDDELHWWSARQLRGAMEAKAISPVEVMASLLERVEALAPKLNPFITVVADQALAQARGAEQAIVDGRPLGALHGVPVSVKDAFWTAGIRTTYGSKVFEDFVPTEDATFVARLCDAGAIIFAKANTPEFCVSHRTLNLLTPECVSPWDPGLDRSSGGSSGGSAVGVAAGLGPVSIGSDGGGSIRLPAALNGVFGFAASRGRVPVGPATYHSPTQLVGPITRDVRDAALVAGVMAGATTDGASGPPNVPEYQDGLDAGAAGVRIAWTPDLGFIEPIRADVVDVVHDAAMALRDAGAHVDEPGLRLPNVVDAFERTASAIVGATSEPTSDVPSQQQFLAELRQDPERWGRCTPITQAHVEGRIERPSLLEYALSIRPSVRNTPVDDLADVFDRYDLVVCPTIASPTFEATDPAITWQSYTAYTVMVNAAGYAGASVPAGYVDDLPVGLQLIAPPDREPLLLRAARALETVRPWAHRRPPVG